MKKITSILLSGVMMLGCLSAVACDEEQMTDDGKTIDVKIIKSGYGTAWFEAIAEKFETLYAEEGYKVNLLTPSNAYKGETVLTEMRNYKNEATADLYIVEGVYPEDVIDLEFGVCAEELSDVYNNGAINFDGTVSNVAIKDTEGGKLYNYMVTDPLDNTKFYSFQWHASCSGLAVNQKVLRDYGIDTLPNTTDEMFEAYKAIYNGANGRDGSLESGIYPTTWGGENAASYPYNTFVMNFAGMLGHDKWEDFFTLEGVRDDIANGYKFYNEVEAEMTASLEAFVQYTDVMNSCVGSVTQRHDMAQAQLIMGNAAFMSNGSYFYNEVKTNFSHYLPNMRFIPIPLVSEFGVTLKLDGTGSNRDKCDEILSYLCSCFDSGMNQTEMLAAVREKYSDITFTEEQIQRVWEARGTCGQNLQGQAFIAKNSDVKDAASLLLRMMASEDAANVCAEYGLPTSFADTTVTEYAHQFVADAMGIRNRLNKGIFLYNNRGLRKELNLPIFGAFGTLTAEVVATIGVVDDITERDYGYWGEYFYDKIDENISTNWSRYVSNAGY